MSEKQNDIQHLKGLITKIEHHEEKQKLLDEVIAFRERELQQELLKLENDFSDETKKHISNSIDSTIPHEVIFDNVKDSISSDISYEIFNDYLLARKKNRKYT